MMQAMRMGMYLSASMILQSRLLMKMAILSLFLEIYLPEGKKPFVLSQDDVNYYDYMEGDGLPLE